VPRPRRDGALCGDRRRAVPAPQGRYARQLHLILRAKREVPRRVARNKTIGVRIPGHPVAHALLAELGEPMLSATLLLPGDSAPLAEAQEIRERLEHQLELVIDGGACGVEPSTVIDLTEEPPRVVRQGKGSLAPFAVEPV
jgi:tRNA threonylcarbamoyl adenosine modification protein (Sua5/YciO/YrdC/YwlC family)